MQKRHLNRENYFKEQAVTTQKYYIPYLLKHIGQIPSNILEVGCGEGGNLLPFAQMGCEVTGIDMADCRIEQARNFFQTEKQKGTFIASDIFDLKDSNQKYPLILIHDVIEHIARKEQFLKGLKDFLLPQGFIYIGFPAWQMPFGGHQQIARSRIISHTPFIHLLPTPAYKYILKLFGEKENTISELLSIKNTRCPIELFLKTIKRSGYRIIHQEFYLINPHYETKFGLTPKILTPLIAKIPYLRNYFCTGCFYIIKLSEC